MKKAFLQLHGAVFLAGFTAILGKLIDLNEGMLVWWRIFLTVIVLSGWMFFTGQLEKVKWSSFEKMSGVGFIIAMHWLLFYGSIKYANISVALVCFSVQDFLLLCWNRWYCASGSRPPSRRSSASSRS